LQKKVNPEKGFALIQKRYQQQRTSQQSHRILIFSEVIDVPVGEANLDFFISCFGTDDEG